MNINQLAHQTPKPKTLTDFLAHLEPLTPLFDSLPNVVFFIKNCQAQYVLVNETLVRRLGFQQKHALIGLTSSQIFGKTQGDDYTLQDLKVLEGKAILDKLELHTYLSGQLGWCITQKIPIYNEQNAIIAMAGISVDVDKDNNHSLRQHKRLVLATDYIKANLEQKLTVQAIAKHVNMSVSQLERLFKSVLNLSPLQMIQKLRLELALSLLKDSNKPIVEIALLCGYADHSAFSRQFKQLTGSSPSLFRSLQ